MADKINKCTIVSGAPDCNVDYIKNNINLSSFIIAADSGYKWLVAAGIVPQLIIGDFDSSIQPDLPCEIIKLNKEKAFTDTLHCVMEAERRGYNDITILNAIGNRFDHTYSNVLCLDYCRKKGISCRIQNEYNRLSLITSDYSFARDYQHFSLFAFLEDCTGVKIKGAYYTAGFYDLEELDINMCDQFAQSNYVCDDFCEISLKSGTLLLVESND